MTILEHFVILATKRGQPIYVNPSHIVCARVNESDPQRTILILTDGTQYDLRNSIQEVDEKISEMYSNG